MRVPNGQEAREILEPFGRQFGPEARENADCPQRERFAGPLSAPVPFLPASRRVNVIRPLFIRPRADLLPTGFDLPSASRYKNNGVQCPDQQEEDQ